MTRLLCLCLSFLSFSLLFPGHPPNPTSPFSPPFTIVQYLHTDPFPVCKCVAQASAAFLCFWAIFLYILGKSLLESGHVHFRPRCLGAERGQCSKIWKVGFCPQFPQSRQQRRLLAKVPFLVGDEPQKDKNSDCTRTQISFTVS